MKDKNADMDDLLAGYFSQSISPDQLNELKTWVNASPENKKQFLSMREVWLATISASDRTKFDKDEAFKHFLARTGQVSVNSRRKFLKQIIWQSAAAIAILITVSYASFRQGSEQVKNRFAAIVIESPWGSKTKTYLPDGTLVWLNSGSKISYSQGFGVNDRKVELSGEGYFEVTRNEKLPFGVKTEELLRLLWLPTVISCVEYPI
ncbi:hypothetical protein AGMMS50239_41190 [Bacteroidia bacterium]|nr:hypothetical protein AGMMS50239_41190 [Bacteroidia bacterium]